MKYTSKLTKVLSIILALTIVLMSVPAFSFSASAATTNRLKLGGKAVDPSTYNSWTALFPSDDTTQAGRIWTDKSVFADASSFSNLVDVNGQAAGLTMFDSNNNFIVALSALASNKSIVGYSYTPTDTMLVLDVSGSMATSGYVDDLVTSANDAIDRLLGLNKHNRVGVVLYSGSSNFGNSGGNTASVLLPLDRYTHQSGTYLTNNGQSSISINSGVRDGNNNSVTVRSKNVVGGTYIQNGVYMAMEEFLAVTDTVIPDGELQAGTARTPIFVLMSDGEPTTATTNFAGQNNGRNTVGLGTSNLGDGGSINDTALKSAVDFVNQLTAAYVVKTVDDHYAGATPLFYTLGLGANNQSLDSAVLNPEQHENTDDLWADYVETAQGSNLLVDIESGRYPDQVAVSKLSEITSTEQKNYVTRPFAASNAAGLITAFGDIVNQIIIQSLYYPTLVEGDNHDHDGFVEFHDDIGHYMDVKDIKGIVIGNTLFTGERLATAFREDSFELKNPDGTPTDKGDNVVWSVMQRIGITDVQVARDLINSAYNAGQLRSFDDGTWSNYIGWYADDNGNFMGHWHEGHTAADIPEIGGIKATYINRSYGMLGEVTSEHAATDLMYISTQVHTRIADNNVSVIWKVPASLVPVVSYNITINAETINEATEADIEYVAAEPIRLLFEVGLNDDITPVNVVDKVTDPAAHIVDSDGDGKADDGRYYFYTNWFNGNVNHEHFPTTEDTIVFYEPSVQNERYYYSEETPVFINTAAAGATPVYEKYKGAMPTAGDGNEYYREYVIFRGTQIVKEYEAMSDATIGVLTAANQNTDGTWDVPAGTVHRVLEPYNDPKQNNVTGSLPYSQYPVVEQIPNSDGFYIGSLHGNNGVLYMDIPHGIKLTKEIDDTLYGTDNYYEFALNMGSNSYGRIPCYFESADGTLTKREAIIIGGEITVSIKAGESFYLLDTDTYTVSELINGDYKVASLYVDGVLQNGTTATLVPADGFSEAVFTNTRVVNDGTIVVSKEIVHDEAITYNENQTYDFEWYNAADPGNKQTFTIKASETRVLSGLTPGATYVINEINIPNGYTPVNNNIQVTLPNTATAVVPVHFVNEYEPLEVRADGIKVTGTKALSGRGWLANDSFNIRLQMLEGANWVNVGDARTVTAANQSYTFSFLDDSDLSGFSFEEVGDYRFRVIEEVPANPAGGITYDEVYHYFTVRVADATMDGRLEIEDIIPGLGTGVGLMNELYTVTADFENVYAPVHGDELIITIDKTVTDRVGTGHSREGFVFGLFAEGGTTPIVTSAPTDANGHTAIDLTFPAADAGREYTFEIREIVPDEKENGMDYDDAAQKVVIKIVDNLDGTVSAVVVTNNGNLEGVTLGFENIYDPADVEVVLTGTKEMTGRDFAANEFTFELLRDGENVPVTVGNAAPSNKTATFTFEKLTFDKVGTYGYTLTEKRGSAKGVTYSGKSYDIEIIVSDDSDNDGVLNHVVKIDGVETDAADFADTLVFENSYAPVEGDSVTVEINKLVTDNVNAGLGRDGYRFGIYDATTGAEVDVAETAGGSAQLTLDFDPTDAGREFNYEVREIVPATPLKGMTYDDAVYTVKVKVTDNLDGTVSAKIITATGEEDSTRFNFENVYDPADVKVELLGTKVMDGREFAQAEFEFELLEDGKTVPATAGNDASVDKAATFKYELSYSAVGVYRYTLTEKVGTAGGVTYSTEVYEVEVTVSDDTDNDGILNASVKVGGVIVPADKFAETLVFENIYEVAPAAAEITAKKTLNGRVLADGEFEFELYDANKTLLETVKNKADGSVQFSSVAITAEGEHVFYVKEKAGNAANVTYDAKEYKVTVAATDNGEGEYILVYKYELDTAPVEGIAFVNTYTPPAPPVVPEIPQTGDSNNINLWLALLFVSGGVLGTTALRKKRKVEN
ncbi:MAG: hypothetical protein IKL44_05835 [Clostridia bacterium]|nr:hypothetical protein [Clostridia bacterium]